MNNYRISDDAASGLVVGRVPEGAPELAPLAQKLAEYRYVALEQSASPQPSAALAALLDGTARATVRTMGARTARAHPSRRRALGGFLSLGLGLKIGLGVALGAAAVTGAGAADLLPGATQDMFDTVVSTVTGTQQSVSETFDDGVVGVVPSPSPEPSDSDDAQDGTELEDDTGTETEGDSDEESESGESNNGNSDEVKSNNGNSDEVKSNNGKSDEEKSTKESEDTEVEDSSSDDSDSGSED